MGDEPVRYGRWCIVSSLQAWASSISREDMRHHKVPPQIAVCGCGPAWVDDYLHLQYWNF